MTSAAEVINEHARLTAAWRNPPPKLEQYVSAFAGDVVSKRGSRTAGTMFWPMETARVVRPWVQLVGRDLFSARVYQVTGEMCRVITAMYRKSTESTTMVSWDELPAEAGFAWLDEPPGMRDRWGKITRPRALSWASVSIPSSNGELHPGIRLMTWADTYVTDDYTPGWQQGVLAKSERTIGRLQMQHAFIMPLDQQISDSDAVSKLHDNEIAWFHALCMLLSTEIVTSRRAALPRSVLGQLRRHVKYPEVSVVTLRRVAARPEDAGDAVRITVDWSRRWLVQGHHRHIEQYRGPRHHAVPLPADRGHCALCGARITWVHPFIKGPDGLPFKPADVVYRLRR